MPSLRTEEIQVRVDVESNVCFSEVFKSIKQRTKGTETMFNKEKGKKSKFKSNHY